MGDGLTATLFANNNDMPWPAAFGAAKFIDALRTAEPTVFVVAADGRISWIDGSSRSDHDLGPLANQLEAAIERALTVTQP